MRPPDARQTPPVVRAHGALESIPKGPVEFMQRVGAADLQGFSSVRDDHRNI
jgi:hypothetical protein